MRLNAINLYQETIDAPMAYKYISACLHINTEAVFNIKFLRLNLTSVSSLHFPRGQLGGHDLMCMP